MTDVTVDVRQKDLGSVGGRMYERDPGSGEPRQVLSDYEVYASLVAHAGAIWKHIVDTVDGDEVVRYFAQLPGEVVHLAVVEDAEADVRAAYQEAVQAAKGAGHAVTVLAKALPEEVQEYARRVLAELEESD